MTIGLGSVQRVQLAQEFHLLGPLTMGSFHLDARNHIKHHQERPESCLRENVRDNMLSS